MKTLVLAAIVALFAQAAGGAQDQRPLPDSKEFLDAVRQNLARSEEAQRNFAYRERRTNLSLNPFGHIGTNGARLYEITPVADGRAVTRRLLEQDGKPVNNGPVERFERRATPRARSAVDDVSEILDVKVDRRDMLDGRNAIVVSFKAK